MAAKKTAPVTGKSITKWDEELARQADIGAKMEENSLGLGNSISLRGGIMKYKDAPIPGNKMNVIILDWAFVNTWYKDDFDPDTPVNPDCFALGKVEDQMAAHELSENKQQMDADGDPADKCAGCWANQWASAEKGRGKACKNKRRFIMITEDALETGISDAQAATMQLPVTSVKGWAGYVTSIKDTIRRPPIAVITEISVVPDAKSQFAVQFRLKDKVDNEHLDELMAKAKAVQKQLMQPYTPMPEEQVAPKRGAGKAAARRGPPAKKTGKAR
jgi:hypothetical protein